MGTGVGKVIFNKIGKLYRIQTNLNKLHTSSLTYLLHGAEFFLGS